MRFSKLRVDRPMTTCADRSIAIGQELPPNMRLFQNFFFCSQTTSQNMGNSTGQRGKHNRWVLVPDHHTTTCANQHQ
jgi:hypothetical protein